MAIRAKTQTPHTIQLPQDSSLDSKSTTPATQVHSEPNKDLGLAKNAASHHESTHAIAGSPMFLGVSRSGRKAKSEYLAVCDALKGVESGDGEKLRGALSEIGYQEAESASYVKGDDRVKISKVKLGNNTGHKIRFSRGKKRFEAISFSNSVIPIKLWNLMQERFEAETSRFSKARARNPELALPTDLQSLKAFVKLGQNKKQRKKDTAREKEISTKLTALANKLNTCRESGNAPKGVVIYVAGPDAAGKSSTGAIVMGALEKAGYATRRESFKAPTKAEREQHWLKRFDRGVPQEGEAIFWDRGPAGDSVYGEVSPEKCQRMGKEFSEYEAKLTDDGILFVKIELYADLDKQAKTFGKRLGRQFCAQTIAEELQGSGTLTESQRSGLELIIEKVDAGDFRALTNYKDIQSRFVTFVKNSSESNEWLVTDATNRHKARLGLIQAFDKALDAFQSP